MGRHHAHENDQDILNRFEVEFPDHEWEKYVSRLSGIEFVLAKHGDDPEYVLHAIPFPPSLEDPK
jgi:hypothetical protein